MSQEYEILEAAFAQAGRDLEEARASKSLLTQQLDGSERERGALSQRVRSLEALAASRQVDAAEQAAREKVASTILAEKDAALSAQAEDLRLERNIVLATRQQVDAAEAERTASAARIEVLRARVAEAYGEAPPANPGDAPATGEASWEALLHEQVRALEQGLASRDAELSTLRAQLEGSRREARRLKDESPLTAAREEAAANSARLRAELAATQAELEAKGAEASAASASAALMRSRLAEQAHWISRRDDQLASMRREQQALRDELSNAKEEVKTVREAVEAERAAEDKENQKRVKGGGAAALANVDSEARIAALREQVGNLENQLAEGLASGSQRLAQEASQTQKVHGELQAVQQALSAARAEAAEASSALRLSESRCAGLDGERRTKALEVARLQSELGAMSARLQASAQEVKSTDQMASSLREQRGAGEREVQRLRDGAILREDLNTQLKAALARESERVAKAWEQREGLRLALQKRDDALERSRAELQAAKDSMAAAQDELEQLREQRRLSEVLLRGAEERASLRTHALTAAKDESAKLEAEIASLTSRLTSLRDVELARKEEALQRADEEVQKAMITTESRDERVNLLTEQLNQRGHEILSLRSALGVKEEELRAVKEGPVKALEEQLHASQAEAKLASLQRDDAVEAIGRLRKTLERRTEEVTARGEQLRISHESALLLTLEATLKDERLQSLTDSLNAERSRNEREGQLLKSMRQESDHTGKQLLELTQSLGRERERCGLLELRLSQRDEQASSLIEDLRSAEARGDGKEARLQLLKQKAAVASEERELFDQRLGELTKRMSAHEEELGRVREERMVLLTEATSAQADAEASKADAHQLRTELNEALARLGAREDQIAALNGRLAAAREDLDVQLAMVQEEVRGAQIRLEAKDVALDVQLEEALSREQQAQGFMSEVGTRLKMAKDAMASKDELLASLQSKLHNAVNTLRAHEETGAELKRSAAHDRKERDDVVHKLNRLEERHELVQADYHAASAALDNYRDSLVHAEVRMKQDRERMAGLQQELRELQSAMARPPTGGVGVPQMLQSSLPPLGSAAAGADVGSSRVHFLYFLSSFLLLKTALHTQGEMANVGAQEVFEEIVRNEVPLEEWPTYIFTRVYCQRGGLYDSEIAALKAVAKHEDVKKMSEGGVPRTPAGLKA